MKSKFDKVILFAVMALCLSVDAWAGHARKENLYTLQYHDVYGSYSYLVNNEYKKCKSDFKKLGGFFIPRVANPKISVLTIDDFNRRTTITGEVISMNKVLGIVVNCEIKIDSDSETKINAVFTDDEWVYEH